MSLSLVFSLTKVEAYNNLPGCYKDTLVGFPSYRALNVVGRTLVSSL